MALNYMDRDEPVIGANDAGFVNTFDRANAELYAAYCVEHTDEGDHSGLGSCCFAEIGFYQATGDTAQIALENPLLHIRYLEIYSLSEIVTSELVMVSSAMPAGSSKRCADEAFTDNDVLSLGTGYFSIGTSTAVNSPMSYYIYLAYGTVEGLTAEGAGAAYVNSEIDWIQHGEDIEVSDPPDRANDPMTRATYQVAQKWQVGHDLDTGAHKASAFPGVPKILVGEFDCDGTVQTVELEDESFVMTRILLLADSTEVPCVKTSSMSQVHILDHVELSSDTYITLSTGEFTIDGTTSLFTSGQTYYYIVFGT